MASGRSPQVMRVAAGIADKPAPRASLQEKLELFRTQAAETGRTNTEKTKGGNAIK